MTGTLQFEWNHAPVQSRINAAGERVMRRLAQQAHSWWMLVVPVVTGQLRDSWFDDLQNLNGFILLTFGARAPYAIYVEVGTTFMEPRAPVRQTAGEAFALLPFMLADELSVIGMAA